MKVSLSPIDKHEQPLNSFPDGPNHLHRTADIQANPQVRSPEKINDQANAAKYLSPRSTPASNASKTTTEAPQRSATHLSSTTPSSRSTCSGASHAVHTLRTESAFIRSPQGTATLLLSS